MVISQTLTPARGSVYSFVDLGDSARLVTIITPENRGHFEDQAREALSLLQSTLAKQPLPMTATMQTVFLRDPATKPACQRLLAEHYGSEAPVTNFVLEPPCNGAALALEVWAIGGPGVRIERFGPLALAVTYDRVRWVYCAGIHAPDHPEGVYAQTCGALTHLRDVLGKAAVPFEQVVRTWYFLGDITGREDHTQRYMELNRARTDFYWDVPFCRSFLHPNVPHGVFPASTGIGTGQRDLVLSCLSLQTRREDVFLLPLENPQQTPAYAYPPKYSPQSPKFSRAMAVVLGNYVTTWISGTASIIDSESRHPGDAVKQTEQTIDNIQRLISAENFAVHGVKGAGVNLRDLAKIRVYLKREQDFKACEAVCRRRFGEIPALFAVADVCRPELLVEIEGVAFTKYAPGDGK